MRPGSLGKGIRDVRMQAHPFSRTLTEIGNTPTLRREAVQGDMEVSSRRLRDKDGRRDVGAVEFQDLIQPWAMDPPKLHD